MFPSATSNHISASHLASKHLKTWEKTLGLRISLQKPLDIANKLPLFSDYYPINAIEQSDGLHTSLKRGLCMMQELLASEVDRCHSNDNKNKRIKSKTTVTTTTNEDDNIDVAVSWGNIISHQDQLQVRWESIMNKWHARLNFGSEKSKAKLKVLSHSLWEQLEHLLNDDARNIEKSRLSIQESPRIDKAIVKRYNDSTNATSNTSTAATIARLNNSDLKSKSSSVVAVGITMSIADCIEHFDEEVYDDRMFYALLLKTFITSSSMKANDGFQQDGEGVVNTMRAGDLAALRLYRKKKSNVERKASKGRKVRYQVHDKLQNFMFPITSNESFSCEIDTEKLFISLFQ